MHRFTQLVAPATIAAGINDMFPLKNQPKNLELLLTLPMENSRDAEILLLVVALKLNPYFQ